MSQPAPAVFLSYCSQDGAAARRICEALRATGVEVWFDQNELRGGDAWDQNIRRQIKECALFVPLISANTQARREGYFRLEWKLAVDRSHLMSDDQAFLFPVLIDDTPEPAARVPDRFREVQWTRLAPDEPATALAARVAAVLGRSGHADVPPVRAPASSPPRRKPATWIPWAALGLGLVGAAFFILRPHGNQPAPATSATPAAPTSKAEQLVAQARGLYEPWDFATADDFKLADRLLKEATDLEARSAEAWAALAIVSYALNVFGADRSEARDVILRTAAERAFKLAPESEQARLAMALRHRRVPGNDEAALAMLEALAKQRPTDRFILRQLGSTLSAKERDADALARYQQAAALPGGDPIALVSQARTLQRLRRVDEAEAAVDAALRARPDYGYAHVIRIGLRFYERGDLERTKDALREIPAGVLSDERVASLAAIMWYIARDAEAASNALRYVSRDYVESNVATLPKGFLAGVIHQLAGRRDAALLEWRQALRVLQQRLDANSTSAGDVGDKAMLLALLGEREPATEALRAYEQLRRLPAGQASIATWQVYAELDRGDEVLDFFGERLRTLGKDGAQTYAAIIRYHPALDRFREQPRFKELASAADRVFAR
jgi:tetratricopeptide (TPR) repeat protein